MIMFAGDIGLPFSGTLFFFFFGLNFVHNGKNIVISPKSVYIYLSGTWKIEQS